MRKELHNVASIRDIELSTWELVSLLDWIRHNKRHQILFRRLVLEYAVYCGILEVLGSNNGVNWQIYVNVY